MALSRWVLKISKSWDFTALKKPSSTSLALRILCFSSLPSLVALCCTSSSLSVSLLFCEVQNSTQFSRCGLTSAEQRRTITFNLSALLLLKYVVSLHHYNGILLPYFTLWSSISVICLDLVSSESARTVHPVPLPRLSINIWSGTGSSISHLRMPVFRLLRSELMASPFFTHLRVHPSSPCHTNLFCLARRDCVANLSKIKVNIAQCSPFIYRASHLHIEGNQAAQPKRTLGKPVLAVHNHMLVLPLLGNASMRTFSIAFPETEG